MYYEIHGAGEPLIPAAWAQADIDGPAQLRDDRFDLESGVLHV